MSLFSSSLIVQKYGGTSVGTPERIKAVAQKIAKAKKEGKQLIVVVSAMGHTTDELLGLAKQVSQDPPSREIDMLLTAGERISMALLAMALSDLQIKAITFTGSQTGIITTDHHRRARILKILGDRVKEVLSQGAVAIVAGFQGVSEQKEITTLGRGGSDTTAVALAAAFRAQACEIYTDVDGVFSADPRIVKDAKWLPQISHEQMAELALRGAGVLHPRCVELAQKFNVPLWVLNSLKTGSEKSMGTQVVSHLQNMESPAVVGVTHDENKCLVSIELMRTSIAKSVWDTAMRLGLEILCPDFQDTTLRFFISRDALSEWQKALNQLAIDGFVRAIDIQETKVPVSIVGHRLTQDGSILTRVFEILDQIGISVTMGQASSLAMTIAVPQARATEVVQKLHSELVSRSS